MELSFHSRATPLYISTCYLVTPRLLEGYLRAQDVVVWSCLMLSVHDI